MLGSAVIVFREVLEAALIIGLVLAVTRDVVGRTRMVITGIAAGIGGALLVALLGDWIAPLAQGVGQEILNAGILMVAVVMLSWHLIWMKKHSQSITHQIKQVGARIESGEQSTVIIAFIIGLAILREGSEVVLFMYGLSTAGSSAAGLLTGGALGMAVGLLVGVGVYFGLSRVPLKQLFRYSGWLILLLTAGLMAQASSYLVQADILPALGYEIWDTSAVLSEQSLLGQFLHIVIGYIAQPMGIQILAYVMTILVVSLLMYLVSTPMTRSTRQALTTTMLGLFIASFLTFASQEAQATHKIYGPHVEEGEAELEMRAHTTFDSDDSRDGQEKIKLEAGYGVNEFWFTALGGEIEEDANGDLEYEATYWENIFQLTEQGEYWVDVGAYLEYEYAHEDGNFDKIEAKLLLEKSIGKYVNTMNLIASRQLGSGASSEIDYEYAWRTKYLYSKSLEPAIEIYGEEGGNASIGPVISGVFSGDTKGKWVYEAGYLFGVNDAVDGILKLNIEYEFRL